MNPITHLLASWVIAESARLDPRDRILVTLGGVLPDLDGLGIVGEALTRHADVPLSWWSDYHHVLCHNLGFGLLLAAGSTALASRRLLTPGLVLLAFHIHLLGDLVGARGPDGFQWPIPYLLPFSDRCSLTWEGQWALNAWPNLLLTVILLVLSFFLAWRRGYSPLSMVSSRADRAFVSALRARFGSPGPTARSDVRD